NSHHLVIDFSTILVTHALQPGGGTEVAVQTASHLGGNTGSDSFGSRNQNGFHHLAVEKFDRMFDSTILAVLHQVNMDVVYGEIGFKKFPDRLGDIRHIVKILQRLVP